VPRKKQTYRVSGTSPVVVGGVSHHPGETFEASPDDVAFLAEVGAVKQTEKKD